MKTVQDLIELYENERDEHFEYARSCIEKLENKNMDEVQASVIAENLEEYKLIISLCDGFVNNLKLLEENE